MRAILRERFGGPEVLELREMPKPEPAPESVLIKIECASVNAYDWHMLRGAPFLVRLSSGLTKPKDPRLGADIAGRVEAVGEAVTRFSPGDEVFGTISLGGFAEYVSAPAAILAKKPDSVSFEQAASIPIAGLTALQGLREICKVGAGEAVLINGASGGVGTYAVQVAKALGAEVTAVCSRAKVEQTRSLGADHVVDYTREDFTRAGVKYDSIFDGVGNRTLRDLRRALKPHGAIALMGFTSMGRMMRNMLGGRIATKSDGPTIKSITARQEPEDLTWLAEAVAAGTITPVVERSFPLEQTTEAIRYVEAGHAAGKVLIAIGAGSARRPGASSPPA